jgi:hypothetical protein
MPIGDYLKVAAAQLRRAAVARRDETQDLRRSITQREQDVSKTIQDLKTTMDHLRREMSSARDSDIKGQMAVERQAIEQQIRDVQSNLEREKQRINQEIHWKEQQVGSFNNQATDFERQASAMNSM